MAAENSVDILMTIKGFSAECQTVVDASKDPMLIGFQKGKFFEVRDFSLGVGLEDEDARNEEMEQKEAQKQFLKAQGLGKDEIKKALGSMPRRNVRKFSKWLNGEKTESYPLDFQAFEFTRQLDKASPALFDACCNSTTIESAVLVKRKVAGLGGETNRTPALQAYLRIQFANILIVSLDWDVDETVTEKVKFICRGAKVRYRPQEPDGSMGTEVEAGRWDPKRLLT